VHNQKLVVDGSSQPQSPAAPLVTRLAPAAPNPFSQMATLAFSLATRGSAELAIYSVDGRRVRTLARGIREPGEYSVKWDGRDDGGVGVAPGVYYARLVTPQHRVTRAITYLK